MWMSVCLNDLRIYSLSLYLFILCLLIYLITFNYLFNYSYYYALIVTLRQNILVWTEDEDHF